MTHFYSYIRYVLLAVTSGAILLSCHNWDLPTKKTQRDCETPNGTLNAQIQQRKVDFSITGSSGTIDEVKWDFGDGNTKTTTELVTSYTYGASKIYMVKATLTNACGPTKETTLQRDIAVSDAVLPTVTMQVVSGISTNSAATGMTITSMGNATITRYGICWSATSQTPTVNDSKSETVGAGALGTSYPFSLMGLQPNTLYYVRSFAVNSAGVGYSNTVQTFRTGQSPAVTTSDATAVGTAAATANFVVNNPGTPPAVEFGICYSSTINIPDITNSTVIKVESPPTNANVPVALSNLTPNKTYYYRAYAKTASGEVVYGEVKSFTTQPEVVSQDLIASVSFTDQSLQDVSGFNNHVKLVGNPTFTADHLNRPNSAILLNGTSDYFYMPDNSSLNQTDALSISVWIKPGSFAGRTEDFNKRMQIYNKSVFNTGDNEVYSSQIKLENDIGPNLTFITDIKQNSNCAQGKGWQDLIFTSPVNVNQWYHLVFTYSGRLAQMYFNNVLVYRTDNLPANKIDYCPGGELKFGVEAKNYNLPWYFKGAMDDIRIFKRALTAAEVETLFKQ